LPDPLEGRELVLVGGSGGLGAASTELLAATGARLTIAYRSRQDRARPFERFGQITQADITKAGDRRSLLGKREEL
jgi:NAD(P)-dependent dehydrogenase (short-subunit alcohol dehydrogenase family)